MSDQANIAIDPRHLAGNPIVLLAWAGDRTSIQYRIYDTAASALIFAGSFYTHLAPIRLDISDFFTENERQAGVKFYRVCLYSDLTGEFSSRTFTVYGGGINQSLMRKLSTAGTNYFTWKLKNNRSNFFLTTRSNTSLISIPEDELMPLQYYAQGMGLKIKGCGALLATYNNVSDSAETLATIDFAQIRQNAFLTFGKFVSVFEIYTLDDSYACTVLLKEINAKHDYFIKFRNSLGAFEKIAIAGDIMYEPDLSETVIINGYDAQVQAFVGKEQRKTIKNKYSANVGIKTPDERIFLVDALLSEEKYLLTDSLEIPIEMKAESTWFQDTKNEPVSLSVGIEFSDVDSSYALIASLNNIVLANNAMQAITEENQIKIIVS